PRLRSAPRHGSLSFPSFVVPSLAPPPKGGGFLAALLTSDFRAQWTRDLAQDDPQSDADAAVSAAGDDRAFRRAFATALVGPNFLLLEGLKGILTAAGFRVVAAASRVNDLVLGAGLQSQPILLVVDAGDDLRSAVRHIELFKGRCQSNSDAFGGNIDRPIFGRISS